MAFFLAEVTLCVFCWAVFPCVVFFAAAPLARFRLPFLCSRFGGLLRLALLPAFLALWLIGVASFLCVLHHPGSLPLITCLCVLDISTARRLSTAFSKFDTGHSLNNLSRPPSSYERVFKRAKFALFSHLPKANNILVDCFTGSLYTGIEYKALGQNIALRDEVFLEFLDDLRAVFLNFG